MRVVLSGFSCESTSSILGFLNKTLKVDPIYLLVVDNKLEKISQYSSIIHHVHLARRGIPHVGYVPQVRGVDDDLSRYLDKYKLRTLAMMGRQCETGHEFSFQEREHLFYFLVNYWWEIISDLKPDILISRNIPHFAAEYLLFKIAEYKNVTTIALEHVAPFNAAYLISSLDSKKPICLPSELSSFARDLDTIDAINEEVEKVRGDYDSARPTYFKEKIVATQKAKSLRFIMTRLIKDTIKSVLYIGKKHTASIKRNRYPIYDNRSAQSHFSFSLHRWKARCLINKNFQLYSKLTTDQFPEEPFILFAPNYQPERTTMPDARDYYDMLKIVDTLSSVLPEGWKIVYKEHPSVFNVPGKDFFRGHLFRNEEYYTSLLRYKDVILLDHRVNTFSAIDKSEMVCSATGTICYQASIRNKKSVVFSETWFSGCDLIHEFSTRKLLAEYLFSKGFMANTKHIWEEYIGNILNNCFEQPDLLDKKPGEFSGKNKSYLDALLSSLEAVVDNE